MRFTPLAATLVILPLAAWAAPTSNHGLVLRQSDEGGFCGGIGAIQCKKGLVCELDGTYPDAGGKCVKE